jgi:hypothetical protein
MRIFRAGAWLEFRFEGNNKEEEWQKLSSLVLVCARYKKESREINQLTSVGRASIGAPSADVDEDDEDNSCDTSLNRPPDFFFVF